MAPHQSKQRRSVLDDARDSISEASAEIALLARTLSGEGTKASEGAIYRLKQCVIKSCGTMIECICCCFHEKQTSEEALLGEGDKELDSLSSAFFLVFVGQVIALLYLAFTLVYLPAANLSLFSPISLFFHWCVGMCNLAYVQACFTDPGRIPETDEWKEGGEARFKTKERKKTNPNQARWCAKEKKYKPDRAHYSSLLKRNVLKMDHHCPWVNNTVGFYNYKSFFLFILYATISTDMIASLVINLLATNPDLSATLAFFLYDTAIITTMFGAALTPFLLFHIYLICRGMTTIEFISTFSDDPTKSDNVQMYDIGICKNICSTLGNPICWLFPFGAARGDGLFFELNPNWEEPEPLPRGENDEGKGRESILTSATQLALERVDDVQYGCCVVGNACGDFFIKLFDTLNCCASEAKVAPEEQPPEEQPEAGPSSTAV